MRRRHDDADTVSRLTGGILAGAVFQLLDDLQSAVDDPTGRVPFDRNDCPDAAGIMFELLSVKQVVLQSFIYHT